MHESALGLGLPSLSLSDWDHAREDAVQIMRSSIPVDKLKPGFTGKSPGQLIGQLHGAVTPEIVVTDNLLLRQPTHHAAAPSLS